MLGFVLFLVEPDADTHSALCSSLRSNASLILLQLVERVPTVGNRESGSGFVGCAGVWNGNVEAG